MKRVWLVIGLLVLTAGMTPVFAAAKSWEKKIPKDQKVTLVYAEDTRIEKIDGEEKKLGPLPLAYRGAGTKKKPKASLLIMAGERTLSVAWMYNIQTGGWTELKDIKYNFLPGHTYEVIIDQDDEKLLSEMYDNPTAGGVAKGMLGGLTGNVPVKLEIKDITKKK